MLQRGLSPSKKIEKVCLRTLNNLQQTTFFYKKDNCRIVNLLHAKILVVRLRKGARSELVDRERLVSQINELLDCSMIFWSEGDLKYERSQYL